MRIKGIMLTIVALAASASQAELTEKLEVTDRGASGWGEKLEVSRNGAVVYSRLRLDANRDGKYESHIEKFSVSGHVVLSLTFVSGSRGSITHPVKDTQVILSSDKDSWRPDSIFIQIRDSELEYFTLGHDGFYRPAPDEEKKRVTRIAAKTDRMMSAAFRGDAKQVAKEIASLQDDGASQQLKNTPEPATTSVTARDAHEPRQP